MKLSKSLTLPLEAIARTIAILAQKGAGKTYTGMKLSEEMLDAGAQIVCLDPTGVWWGLKADGTGKGFPILVMGGPKADIPLAHTSGAIVADFVVQSGHSVILDLSMLNSNAEQARFVTDFAERLYRAKADSRTALHVFIDEADSFAPQRPQPGEARMLGALEAIVRRGRSRGLGMTMITQRPAVLNKNVLTQADLLIALRVVGVQDHKALGEWTALNGSKQQQFQFLSDLASLPTGEAYFWSPSWLNCFVRGKVLPRRTFDSSQTPEPGKIATAPKLASLDIDKLSAQILATAAEAKANDPKELKKQVEQLRKELEGAKQTKMTCEVSVVKAEDRKLIQALLDQIAVVAPKLQAILGKDSSAPIPAPTPVKLPVVMKDAVPGITDLTGAKFRILTALFWLRNESVTPAKVAFFSRYTVNGHFNNTLGQLRSLGLIAGWSITESGIKKIEIAKVADKPTGRELREWMREKLTSAENRILDVLMNHHGRPVPVDTLAAEAGYTVNGHFNNSLGKLRSLQMAEGGKAEGVKASEVFFQ